jgi:hypothetical protein
MRPPAEAADPVGRAFLLRGSLDMPVHTLFWDERSFTGAWARQQSSLVIFADNILPAASVSFHGGPIGTGLPVELVYWGDWWRSSDGVARRSLLSGRVQALLASDYFSELDQYGIARPRWRGDLIVIDPSAPAAFNTAKDSRQAYDLIEALIDDDVFPDPDEERIAFVVLMPHGFRQTLKKNGAHSFGSDYDFPFDVDKYWAAWIRFFDPDVTAGDDPEDTVRTISHELAEMFTDPEMDGWYAVDPSKEGEISDAAESTIDGTKVKQTAWVNGGRAEAYWSNRHSATVIPVDRDYAARIGGRIWVGSMRTIESGSFRPDPAELALCHLVPECCITDRDYSWELRGRDEAVKLRVETRRYREPSLAWTIEGQDVFGESSLVLPVHAQRFHGRDPSFGPTEAIIGFTASDDGLELRAAGTQANFDVTVGCRVSEGAIDGNVRVNVISTPVTVVGFVGAEVVLDPAYVHAHQACGDAAKAFFRSHEPTLTHTPHPGEPVELDPGVIAVLPAYARLDQFLQARHALALTRLAAATQPADVASAYLRATMTRLPILQIGALAAHV